MYLSFQVRIKLVSSHEGLPLVSMHLTGGLISKLRQLEQTAITTLGSIFNFPLIGSSSVYKRSLYDYKAFVFSLVNKRGRAPVTLFQTGKYSRHRLSIYDNPWFGPTFGGGRDLSITKRGSYSNLGHTYGPPRGYSYRSTSARTFLAGSYRFTPDEVETFYETN